MSLSKCSVIAQFVLYSILSYFPTIDMSTPAVVISPSQKVSKGSTVFMNCNVSSSDVTLNYTWYFRDITLSNSGGVGKNFLVLENTRVEDEGVYSCSVSGARITKKSLPNTLNVHCK